MQKPGRRAISAVRVPSAVEGLFLFMPAVSKYFLTPNKHLSLMADSVGCCLWCLRFLCCHLLYSRLFRPFNSLTGREQSQARSLDCVISEALLGFLLKMVSIWDLVLGFLLRTTDSWRCYSYDKLQRCIPSPNGCLMLWITVIT